LASSPFVKQLRLFDVSPGVTGVAADVSHVDRPATVTGYTGTTGLEEALKGTDLVIIPAGVPRKPGMTRDDLFNTNASIVANIMKTLAKASPNAFVLVISNPVNSTVPIAAEILKKAGVYNPKRLFGVTALDVCRANKFVSENQKLDLDALNVPVIGGHAGITIVPLLSQVKGAKFDAATQAALTKRIMFGGDEVVAAKAGAGSATLSMAWAGYKFTQQVLKAASGAKGVVECAFVESTLFPNTRFFASPVQLGPEGVEKILPLPKFDAFEQTKVNEMLPQLQGEIEKGIKFAASQ
jgi:malate dehydrogenase